jgi:hypothetical protein
MSVSGTSDERFSALADEFIERQRLGEEPSIEGYADDHPELADEIRLIRQRVQARNRPALGAASFA